MTGRGLVRIASSLVAVAAVVVAQQLPAEAKGGTATFDDRSVVQLTRAGAERGKGGLALHLTSKDAVVAGNLAVATTSCDGCHATAISFQVVVADKAPSSLEAGNLAYADNTGCAGCEADAFAYQFVLAFDGNARITGAGRRQLDQVDAALRRLARSGGRPTSSRSPSVRMRTRWSACSRRSCGSGRSSARSSRRSTRPSSVTRPPDALAS